MPAAFALIALTRLVYLLLRLTDHPHEIEDARYAEEQDDGNNGEKELENHSTGVLEDVKAERMMYHVMMMAMPATPKMANIGMHVSTKIYFT